MDGVEIRYSYKVPSLSRRGGIKLHPIADGVLPINGRESYMRKRDKLGNKLVDVVNPRTGFCVGVRSPIEGEPNNTPHNPNPGVKGTHTVETRRGFATKSQNNLWLDSENRVIRTCAMGDGALPTVRTTQPTKERGMRKDSGRAASSVPPGTPGATGKNGSITRSDCEAYIRAMAKGRSVKITDDMVALARKAIKAKRAEAARVLAKKAK